MFDAEDFIEYLQSKQYLEKLHFSYFRPGLVAAILDFQVGDAGNNKL